MTDFRVDQYRRKPEFHKAQVKSVLPEFFQTEYPQLIKFLEAYYRQAEQHGEFAAKIHELFQLRNISSTELEDLDKIFGEIGNGLQSSSFFQEPRLMARLLANFYRAKGTQLSVEQFFLAFFGEEVEVVYPKKNMFIVGESQIGSESFRYIQDDKRYQIFSILLRTGLSKNEYETLYTRFVHPAGFYLAADVVTQGVASIGVSAGDTHDPLEDARTPVVAEGSSGGVEPMAMFTLLTMTDGTGAVTGATETVGSYDDVPVTILENTYGSIDGVADPNSPTLDMDITDGLDMSHEFETMDAVTHSEN